MVTDYVSSTANSPQPGQCKWCYSFPFSRCHKFGLEKTAIQYFLFIGIFDTFNNKISFVVLGFVDTKDNTRFS
jgi:hypothetical protein